MIKICEKCHKKFNHNMIIDGKERNLQNRKYCIECSPFGKHNTSNDPSLSCLEKNIRAKVSRRKKVTVYRKRLKQKLISMHGGKCEMCGYDKNEFPGAFAFHHKDPNEKELGIAENIGTVYGIIEESKKCMLVCVRCHAEIHAIWDRETEKYPIIYKRS